MDGNNSLKRVWRARDSFDGTRKNIERTDERRIVSPIFIEADVVNTFSNEVQTRRARQTIGSGGDEGSHGTPEGSNRSNRSDHEALPVDGHAGESVCADRWANLADDSSKKMIGIFEQTGIFAAVCRHGCVLKMCDMIKSGEL